MIYNPFALPLGFLDFGDDENDHTDNNTNTTFAVVAVTTFEVVLTTPYPRFAVSI